MFWKQVGEGATPFFPTGVIKMETYKKYAYYLPDDINAEQPYFEYIKISEVPEIELKAFRNFIAGQGCPWIKGEGDLAYAMDYERFRRNFYMSRKEYNVRNNRPRPQTAPTQTG